MGSLFCQCAHISIDEDEEEVDKREETVKIFSVRLVQKRKHALG